MLTHGNLVANMAQVIFCPPGSIDPLPLSQLNHPLMEFMEDHETTLCVLPMFHIFAMNVTMSNMLLSGGKMVTLPMFDPGKAPGNPKAGPEYFRRPVPVLIAGAPAFLPARGATASMTLISLCWS